MQQRPSSPRGGRAVLRANNGLLVAAAALLLLTLAPPFVAATVFTVTSTADSGSGSLRFALAAIPNYGAGPHSVVMSPSLGSSATIALTSALALPYSRNVTIDGTLSGGARVQISGAGGSGGYLKPTLGTTDNAIYVEFANVDFVDIGFEVTTNELKLANASMKNTRPASDNLRALTVTDARATLRNVRIEDFTTVGSNQDGAAISVLRTGQVDAADLTVARCAGVSGPAIFADKQGVGGPAARAVCLRCSFLNNTGTLYGGAAYIYNAYASFDRSLFMGNSAQSSGGAIAVSNAPSTVSVSRSYFYGNQAGGGGGAISASPSTELTLRNSAAVGNVAATDGGALNLVAAAFAVHSCTLLNNAAAAGTAVKFLATTGTRSIVNSILYGAASGAALAGNVYGSPTIYVTQNIIKGYTDTVSCPTNGICANGTIDADPQLVQFTEAQADGGPVNTFWMPSSAASPAVNSGDNTNGDAVDMRGAARVFGASVDRGAVEFVPAPSPPPVGPQPPPSGPPPPGPPPSGPNNNNSPTCPTGTAPGTGNCVCAPGDGGASCSRCGAGKFSAGGNGATCNPCVGDSYAKPGSSACTPCAAPGATADKSACRKAPVRAASRSGYTASRMARLHVPAPGLLTGVTGDFAPLIVSLKDPSLNGAEQEDGSIVTVNADGSFVYTPPTRNGALQQHNTTIEFRVTDANGDSLEEAVTLIIDDKIPALAAPSLQSVALTLCNGADDPIPQCAPGRVMASPSFTAGTLDLLTGIGKPRGAPKGIDIRFAVADLDAECVAPLPALKVAAGGAAPQGAVACAACKRCLRRLALAEGDSFTVAVRARKAGPFPASEWSAAVNATL